MQQTHHQLNNGQTIENRAEIVIDDKIQAELEKAKQYGAFVAEHAQRDHLQHLISGTHYRALARLLTARASPEPRRILETFSALTIRSIVPPELQLDTFGGEVGYRSFLQYCVQAAPVPRLIFVRGYLASRWISLLGSHYHINIGFFRQHLAFLEKRNFFDLPPFGPNSALRLCIPTIFERQGAWSTTEVSRLRQREHENLQKYLQDLNSTGESIVRRYSIHNECTFSIEQDISIYIGSKKHAWQVIIWSDAGRDLAESPCSLWRHGPPDKADFDAESIPAIPPIPAKVLADIQERSSNLQSNANKRHTQSISHLPEQYGTTIRPELAKQDVVYALSELFTYYIASENQYLNMLQRQIDEIMRSYAGRENTALDDLHYIQRLVDRHGHTVQELRLALRSWPDPVMIALKDIDATKETEHKAPIEIIAARTKLMQGIEHLQRLANYLSKSASDCKIFITDAVTLEESRRALRKASSMERLTLLAFFFLPLSFTTSFFGTNFKELGVDTTLSIWVLFATLLPVLIFCTILCYWTSIATIIEELLYQH